MGTWASRVSSLTGAPSSAPLGSRQSKHPKSELSGVGYGDEWLDSLHPGLECRRWCLRFRVCGFRA